MLAATYLSAFRTDHRCADVISNLTLQHGSNGLAHWSNRSRAGSRSRCAPGRFTDRWSVLARASRRARSAASGDPSGPAAVHAPRRAECAAGNAGTGGSLGHRRSKPEPAEWSTRRGPAARAGSQSRDPDLGARSDIGPRRPRPRTPSTRCTSRCARWSRALRCACWSPDRAKLVGNRANAWAGVSSLG